MDKKLTLKQKRFADEYIISGNAEQSAIKAGYSEKYARGNAHKLVANVGIKEYIDERLSKINKAKILDAQARRELLSKLADNEDVSPNDRIKAVDVLNKMDATYVNRQEIEMKSSVQFVDDIESDSNESD